MKSLRAIVLAGLASCSSTTPAPVERYAVFVLNLSEKKLFARDPKDDLDLESCASTSQSKAHCYVILRNEYLRLRKDLVDLSNRAAACDSNPVQLRVELP